MQCRETGGCQPFPMQGGWVWVWRPSPFSNWLSLFAVWSRACRSHGSLAISATRERYHCFSPSPSYINVQEARERFGEGEGGLSNPKLLVPAELWLPRGQISFSLPTDSELSNSGSFFVFLYLLNKSFEPWEWLPLAQLTTVLLSKQNTIKGGGESTQMQLRMPSNDKCCFGHSWFYSAILNRVTSF